MCLAALAGNRFFSAFLALFPEGSKSTWEIQKTLEKAFFLTYPQICLNPHLLNLHSFFAVVGVEGPYAAVWRTVSAVIQRRHFC